jgi:predicted outer membrane repeat protein
MAGNLVNSTAVVDGFTITAGQAHYDMQITEPRNRGGGLTMDLSSPTLANLTFVGNVAGYGGAIYCNGSAPNVSNTSFRNNYSYEGGGGALLNDYGSGGTYQNVQFINNVSYGDGGAIYNRLGSNMVLNQATFTGNIADDQLYNDGSGGAIISYNSNTVLNDVTFSGNTAADTGGAMANETSYPQLTNVTFNNNTSSLGGAVYDYMGAGIYTSTVFINNSANLGGAIHAFNNNNVLRDATFENNFASSKGGAYYISSGSPALVNITFSSNDATDDGGAVFIRNSSRPSFTNVTINDNGSSYYALSITEVSTPTLKNTIIANNGVYDCYKSSDSALGAGSGYNLVEDAANACGMVNGVSHNIVGLDPVVGPLQANGGLGDTHALLIGSPALDAGNPAACPAFDQRGVARPQDGDLVGGVVCDIGAFERIPVLFWIYLPLSFK